MSNHSSHTKQTKETARLAKRIRALRDKGTKWERICLELGILTEDGRPDTGLAHRIAFGDYEPKGQELRDRLGLRKLCLSCGRGFRKISQGVRSSLSPWVLWWRRLPREERERRIRKEYEEER